MTNLIEKSVRTSLKPVDSVLGTSFSDKPAPPGGTKEETPVLPDEEAIRRTKRKEAARRFGTLGSGRASTVLSEVGNSEKLGG